MLSYKFICKLWYIILICSDCVADQMSLCSFSSHLAACVILIYFCKAAVISYCGLGIVRQKEESLPFSFAVPPRIPVLARRDQLRSTIKPAWALVQPALGDGGAKLRRSSWLPEGCLLAMGWQWLVGRGPCHLLLVTSYEERIWKLRCLHWTSRIRGRMRPKWVQTTRIS